MNNKSEEEIQITIMILNTLNNDLIQIGREYNITMKRGTMIEDLFNEFVKRFPEEKYSEIKNIHHGLQRRLDYSIRIR